MRILLADDHPLYAEALRALVRRSAADSVIDTVTSLDAAHRAIDDGGPVDLLVLDLHMPGMDGLEGLKRTRAKYPQIRVAIVSGTTDTGSVRQALSLGARGFLPKTLPSGAVVAALQLILAGGTYAPADIALTFGDQSAESPHAAALVASGLTPREIEILGQLARGFTNKEIARNLSLREITIKVHARNIFKKLNVRNRVEAANAARKFGLSASPDTSGHEGP